MRGKGLWIVKDIKHEKNIYFGDKLKRQRYWWRAKNTSLRIWSENAEVSGQKCRMWDENKDRKRKHYKQVGVHMEELQELEENTHEQNFKEKVSNLW